MRRMHIDGMQERIDRLENLVSSVVAQTQGPKTQRLDGTPEDVPRFQSSSESLSTEKVGSAAFEQIQQGVGVMLVNEHYSFYRGATHWSDVLQEQLSDLKIAWSQVQEEQGGFMHTPVSDMSDGPSLLRGPVKLVEVSELLATIPAKATVDRLVARFFDPRGPAVPPIHVLHQPTFMQQYEDHWVHPSQTNVMWLGLLFSIFDITMLAYHQFDEEPPEYEGISKSLSELYRLRTIQCLLMADIAKCAANTLETLICHVIAEYSRSGDGETGIWMIVGLIVRAALQMGYHRDPEQYKNISPFDGEMRRRVWYCVLQLDTISSLLLGLPSMIRAVDYDTAQPLNVYDWELTKDMTDLPPSRPLSQETPIAYLLSKGRILGALRGILDLQSSLRSDSYDSVLKFEEELSRAHLQVPPHLQLTNLIKSANDHPSIISRGVQLEYLYHQGMCLLHRKFFTQSRFDSRFSRSREQCIESAEALLSLQDMLHREAKTRGPITTSHWFRIPLASHDFILAAMMLCLELRRKREEAPHAEKISWAGDTQQKNMLQSLEVSCNIWKEAQTSSLEAWKVHQVLSSMLDTFDVGEKVSSLIPGGVPTSSSPDSEQLFPGIENASSSNGQNFPPGGDIDWALWDSFIEGTSFEDTYQGISFVEHTSNGH